MFVFEDDDKQETPKLADMIVRFCCSKTRRLIPVAVEVHYKHASLDPVSISCRDDLSVHIPNADFATLIVATPYAMNWRTLVGGPRDGEIYECRKFEFEDLLKWRSPCGVETDHDANGFSVGVIDIGFSSFKEFDGLEMVSDRTDTDLPRESHGSRVSRVIGKKRSDFVSGICSNVNIIMYDVGYSTPDGKDSGKWATESVIDAIYFLAEQKGCKVINISGGLNRGTDSIGLLNAVRFAKSLGVICVAAAGNVGAEGIVAPAVYDEVIGVGGIGVCSMAPPGSFTGFIESQARKFGLISKRAAGHHFFHDINTSFGKGLDVVAPSVGVVLPVGDDQVMDLAGTSYAAPVVSSILALIASNDIIVSNCVGEARWKRLKELLYNACYDLGLPKEKQGMGLPIWSARA